MLTTTVIAFIFVVYLSWFSWFVSSVGGGIAVFSLYCLPVAHAAISAAVARRIHQVSPRAGSAMLAAGGAAFCMAYFIAHQILAVDRQNRLGVSAALDVGVLNLIGVAAGTSLAFALLKAPDTFAKPVIISVLTCLLVDALLTYRLVQTDPLASKVLGTVEGMATYGQTGASGFYIANSMALLLPAMLARSRYSRAPHVWWVALVAGVAFIYTCGYLLAMVAALMAVAAYGFLMARRGIKLLVAAVGSIWLAVSANSSLLASLLNWLSAGTTFYEVSKRLLDLANLASTGATDAPSLVRLSLYRDSWAAFLSSPLFGVFVSNPNFRLSNHSTILDALGATGLLGFSALAVAGAGAYRMGARILGSSVQLAGLRATYLTLVFIALVNPIFNQPAIVFSAVIVAPLLCYRRGEDPNENGMSNSSLPLLGRTEAAGRLDPRR